MHELVIVTAKYAIAIPVIGYLILAWYLRKNVKELAIFTIIGLVLTVLLAKLATTIHQDPRPFIRDGVQPYFTSSTDNGFPSDHTTYSALIAFIVLRYKRLPGLVLLLVAILIGAARVKSGVHHAQDIIGGVLIAAIGTYLAYLISKIISKKLLNKTAHSAETDEQS